MSDPIIRIEAIGWTAYPYSFGDGQRAKAQGFGFLASPFVSEGFLYHSPRCAKIIVVGPETFRQVMSEPEVDTASLPVSEADLRKPGFIRVTKSAYCMRRPSDCLSSAYVEPDHVIDQPTL